MIGLYDLRFNKTSGLPELIETHSFNISEIESVSCNDIVELLNKHVSFERMRNEHAYIACLNFDNRLKGIGLLGVGNNEEVLTCIKTIASYFLLMGADRFIVLHNHPNGNFEPSDEDRQQCALCKSAAMIFNIEMEDYIIVSTDGWFSVADNQCHYK